MTDMSSSRPTRAVLAAGVAALALALPATSRADGPPATVPSGVGVFAFGDSAMEMGNLYLLPGQPNPYAAANFRDKGWQRDSNGPVWVERLAPGLRPVNAGTPYGRRLSFAHSGATTGLGDPTASPADVGVLSQVEGFRQLTAAGAVKVERADLFFLEAGPNDIMNALLLGQGDLSTVTRDLSANLAEAARRLAGLGAKTIFVNDIPDIQSAPAFNGDLDLGGQEAAVRTALGVLSANGRRDLRAALGTLNGKLGADTSVVTVKLNELLAHVAGNAKALGFTQPLTKSCLNLETGALCSTDRAVQDQYLFFDSLHLTGRGQALEAAYVASLVDQVRGGANLRFARLADWSMDAGSRAADLAHAGLEGAPRDGFGLFAQVMAGRRQAKGGAGSAAADLSHHGGLAGISYGDGEGWRVAVGAGVLNGQGSFAAGGGFKARKGGIAAAAGERRFGDFVLGASTAYAWTDLKNITRATGIPTLRPRGQTEGEAHRIGLAAGWSLRGDGWFMLPALELAWQKAKVLGYRETDAAGLGMDYGTTRRTDWTAGLSLRAGLEPVSLGRGVSLQPLLSARYVRALDAPDTDVTATLTDNTARPVRVTATDGGRDRGEVAPELRLGLGQSLDLSLSYARGFGAGAEDKARLGLNFRF